MIKQKTFGIYQFIRNGDYYDYPFRESLLSALPIADELIVCECFSDKDDTYNELLKFKKEFDINNKIKIVRHDWVTNFTQLSQIGNYSASFLNTEWIWHLQSDEVIHEDSYEEINYIKETYTSNSYNFPQVNAFKVNYTHLLGNYSTEFDFCYKSIIRISRKDSEWALVGDACELGGGDINKVKDSNIKVFHYGKVHEGKVGFRKEVDFQELFRSIGFPDPKMKIMQEFLGEDFCDYLFLFENSIKEGKVRKFDGNHPKVMEKRIKEFKDKGYEQFISRIKKELKL